MFYSPIRAKRVLASEIRTSAQLVALGEPRMWDKLPAGLTGFDDVLMPYATRVNIILNQYNSETDKTDCYKLAGDLVSIAWEIDKDVAAELRMTKRGKRG